MKRVVVTGGGGQIAYSLLFRIAAGEMLGADQPIALQILEVPEGVSALKGIVMELEDCAFPLLKEIRIGADPFEVFAGAEIAILIGAKPRGPGMERKDLLSENGKIFMAQGKALNEVAHRDVFVFVVGNPCNTNALIALHQAPRLAPERFFAMTRLDQNRACSMLAAKAGVSVREVSDVTIWGNHSSTQVPDFVHARILGKPVPDVIKDYGWLQKEFFSAVQNRGAVVIAARGKSSAASAAQAILDGVRALFVPTQGNEWFSCGVYSRGNSYGIDQDLIFSFPCRSKGNGVVEIVKGMKWDAFLQEKISLSEKELIGEREMVLK